LIANHAAKYVGERRAYGEYGNHLGEIGERRRVLKRMRRVGIEKAAAIGAKHLDGHLAGDGAQGDVLIRAFQRVRRHAASKRLRYAVPYKEKRKYDGHWQQHVKIGAGEIDPEIA